MLKSAYYFLIATVLAMLLFSCSATRYVPQGEYLLSKNALTLQTPKNTKIKIDKSVLEDYIQQRPNRRLLGVGIALGFYNITDTAKHTGWHRFWSEKIGSPPVIYDSALTQKSIEEMDLYLMSLGFFKAQITDTLVVSKKRKATSVYNVNTEKPYHIGQVNYDIKDKFLEQVLYQDTINCLIKPGELFTLSTMEEERNRIVNRLKTEGFWSFGVNYITYTADSTVGNNIVDITLNIRQQTERIEDDGREVLTNHPIYRLSRIVVNSFYDPAQDFTNAAKNSYDSMEYNGIDILYNKREYIRSNILINAVRLSPNEIYDLQSVTRTRDNLRSLGYSANILFSPLPQTSDSVVVTLTDPKSGKNVSTSERQLNCYIQCSPNQRQNVSAELEASTTSDYFSVALSLGYQNINAFRGAEVFGVNFRGAYEFMKTKGKQNSYEFGATVSLTAPRFWLPISQDKASKFKNASSKISVSYSIQQRPDYHRTLVSAVYGYSWTLKNGARFTINPADINLVKVPWVDSMFLAGIENPYLRNSYTSQLIAGLSASYYYNTNPKLDQDGFTFRASVDANGNLFRGLSSLFSDPVTTNEETYYNLFGLRFAQYARAAFDISGRTNLAEHTQFAWRFLLSGGYAYGNSNTIPFERLFFAGGGNSMRGWQVRTLGPGSVAIDTLGNYPNQLGDLHIEANVELRQKVIYGLSAALFFDAGNIWMNSDGEKRPEARFNFNRFYKQIAFNTGIGLRYNIADMLILRFDWGIKLHNPNMPHGQRWFKNLGIADTAIHFAIGLPF